MSDADTSTQTVGSGDYVVKEGDSIDSIAEETGHFWETLWELPENAELKEVREDRTILLPGDLVTIPDLEPKTETRAVDLVHRFVRKGVPARIAFVAQHQDGTVYANCAYSLVVGTRTYEGETDAEGAIDVYVSPSARTGTLKLSVTTPGYESERQWTLRIGSLYPIDTVRGQQERLNNLGYGAGEEDGVAGSKTEAAISAFQSAAGLEETGSADEDTKDALVSAHGS